MEKSKQYASRYKMIKILILAVFLVLTTARFVSADIIPAMDGVRLPVGWVETADDYGGFPCMDLRTHSIFIGTRNIGWPFVDGELSDGGGCGMVNIVGSLANIIFLITIYLPIAWVLITLNQRLLGRKAAFL